MTEPEEAARMAEFHERDAEKLIARYGKGCRPAWVSTDLGLAYHYAKQYRELEAKLREQQSK